MVIFYKSLRIIDSKPKWVIVDEDSNIVDENPTKDQLKMVLIESHKKKAFKINYDDIKCCICGGDSTYINRNGYPEWRKFPDVKRWDGKSYLCKSCYSKEYMKLPDSHHNLMKKVTDFRTGNLGSKTKTGKGFIGEQIVAKVRKLKNCCIETDIFNFKFDLSKDPEYGMIQVKLRVSCYGDWYIKFGIEHNFDTLFVLCMDKNMKNVERVYTIPEEELYGMKSLTIMGSENSKWEMFRIDEKPYNEAYQNMKLANCKVLRKK